MVTKFFKTAKFCRLIKNSPHTKKDNMNNKDYDMYKLIYGLARFFIYLCEISNTVDSRENSRRETKSNVYLVKLADIRNDRI